MQYFRSFAPYFSLFQEEGKFLIDDIIEGGEDDFFQSPQMQADYFSLIGELRNPNSTNKGKILTFILVQHEKIPRKKIFFT
jgi:hypothetical protein